MTTAKHVYTDDELDAMCIDKFLDALGVREQILQDVEETHEIAVNNPEKLYSWNDHVAKYGMD